MSARSKIPCGRRWRTTTVISTRMKLNLIHVCIYIYIHIHTYLYIYTYIHMYVHTHTHIYIIYKDSYRHACFTLNFCVYTHFQPKFCISSHLVTLTPQPYYHLPPSSIHIHYLCTVIIASDWWMKTKWLMNKFIRSTPFWNSRIHIICAVLS